MEGYANHSDDFEMTFVFDLQYTGGKVEAIAFTIDQNTAQADNRPELMVNGKAYEFEAEKMQGHVHMLRSMKLM